MLFRSIPRGRLVRAFGVAVDAEQLHEVFVQLHPHVVVAVAHHAREHAGLATLEAVERRREAPVVRLEARDGTCETLHHRYGVVVQVAQFGDASVVVFEIGVVVGVASLGLPAGTQRLELVVELEETLVVLDRKSTRLNSSH